MALPELPPNARLMGDGSIRLPARGRGGAYYPGWILSDKNPFAYVPETIECEYRIHVIEDLPCCGKTLRMRCAAIKPNIPITYGTCCSCEGTEEGIANLQRKLDS